MLSKSMKRSRLFTVLGLVMLAAAGVPAHAQLVDGTFANPLVPFSTVLGNNFTPMQPGVWGQEVSTISGVAGLVTPPAGATMLRMNPGGGVTTQAGQAIDLSSFSALIASGANATLGAFFNAGSQGPVGGVTLSFFSGNTYNTLIGNSPAAVTTMDNSTSSWQQVQLTAPIPANASWALAQVYYSNPTMGLPTGGTQPGFVDEAYFRVTAVPEPSTWAMMGLGALGMAWRRRALRAD